MSYETELAFATDLAHEAGKIMTQYFRSNRLETEWKADKSPVTVADHKINDMVIERVKTAYPEYGILGEEASFEPDRLHIWICDPIDGTVPYSIGMPVSTFSLALVDRSDGQPVVAVTHDPFLQETYTATKGGGTYLNGRPIHTTDSHDFSTGYLSLSSRSYKGDGYDFRSADLIEEFRNELGSKMLSFVSFVYTANRVAAGQLLVTIVGDTTPWDIAGCSLIVMEAGGIVVDFAGKPRRFDESGDGCIMAANQEVADEFLKRIRTNQ